MAENREVYKSQHLGKEKESPGLVKIKGMWLPAIYLKFEPNKIEKIETFEARPDDVWLCSYPKSGTSWLQKILYLIIKGENDLATKDLNSDECMPYIEGIQPVIDKLTTAASPRLVKTHMTVDLLPPSVMKNKAKVLYIARNVKDVSVSDYHFHQLVANIDYKGAFEDFYKEFLEGKVCYSDWWNHVAEFWKLRDEENVLFLKYEDLHKDAVAEIKKIAKFLGVECDDAQVKRIVDLTTFTSMKEDPKANHSWHIEKGVFKKDHTTSFLRKGKVGDWKNYYTDEMSKEVDEMNARTTDPLGLTFDYDIQC